MSLSLEKQIEALQDLYRSERDPDGRAFAPLADAYRRAGLVREALALLREGLAELPDFTTGHVVAARVYMDTGLTAEAELSSRRALELDPENALALQTLAVALDTRGAVDEAEEVRKRLAELEAPAGWSGSEEGDPEAGAREEPTPGVDPTSLEADGEVVDIEVLLAEGAQAPEVAETEVGVEDDEVVDIEVLLAEESHGPEVAVMDAGVEDDDVVDLDEILSRHGPTILSDFEEAQVEEAVPIDTLLAEGVPALDVADFAAEARADEVVSIDSLLPGEAEAPDARAYDVYAQADERLDDDVLLAPEAAVLEPTGLETRADAEEFVEIVDHDSGEDAALELAGSDNEAGTGQAAAGEVIDIDALRVEEEPAYDVAASAPSEAQDVPREVVSASIGSRPEEGGSSSDDLGDGLPVVTRTLAELFVAQGLTDRAIGVYRQLVTASPGDGLLEGRLAELEASAAASFEPEGVEEETEARHIPDRPDRQGAQPEEDDVSDHAWHVGAHEPRHDVDTPFAWTDTERDEGPSSPAISAYFDRLLSWDPSGVSGPRGPGEGASPAGGLEEERNGEDG